MGTDVMIRQLRALAEKHKNDKVYTFQTRWSDVANSHEEQLRTIEKLKETIKHLSN